MERRARVMACGLACGFSAKAFAGHFLPRRRACRAATARYSRYSFQRFGGVEFVLNRFVSVVQHLAAQTLFEAYQ
jgi:hypothetical protein